MAERMERNLPELKISQFEGPLDLLCHLIEKNQIDIYDIPIAEITEQYLTYLSGLSELDMDTASDFLVMASTLLHIKSRLLLPQRSKIMADEGEDPREELVMRILAYRRCKTIAVRLKNQHEQFAHISLRLPEPVARLGIHRLADSEPISWSLFVKACERLSMQNRARFQDQAERITGLLKREKISLSEKMVQIWQSITRQVRVFFHELFPTDSTTRAERVTGFLALLELMRLNRINVRQDRPFDVMLIQKNQIRDHEDKEWDGTGLPASNLEENDYA